MKFADLISRKIWGEKVKQIEVLRKKDKKLPELPQLDLIHKVAEFWNLTEYLPQVRAIQRINESLKENKLKGNTGGVPYEWYYLAAKYLESHPGIEDVREVCQPVISFVQSLIEPIVSQYQIVDGWDDLRLWVQRVVMLPGSNREVDTKNQVETFLDELSNYNTAKKSGRGKQLIWEVFFVHFEV